MHKSLAAAVIACVVHVGVVPVALAQTEPSADESQIVLPPAPPPAVAPAPSPVATGVLVTVRAKGSVSIAGETCVAPCAMSVPPGRHLVRVQGKRLFEQTVDLSGPTTLRVRQRREGLRELGIAGLTAGPAVIAAGGALTYWAFAENPRTNPCGHSEFGTCYNIGWELTALVAKIAGVSVLAIGTLFTGVGSGVGFGLMGKDEIRAEPTTWSDREQPALRLLGLGVAPTPGGVLAGATLAF